MRVAKEIVSKGWTQRANARDKDGKETGPASKDAVCWCAAGSLSNRDDIDEALDSDKVFIILTHALGENIGKYGHFEGGPLAKIAEWNDTDVTDQEHVLERLNQLRDEILEEVV